MQYGCGSLSDMDFYFDLPGPDLGAGFFSRSDMDCIHASASAWDWIGLGLAWTRLIWPLVSSLLVLLALNVNIASFLQVAFYIIWIPRRILWWDFPPR